MLICAGTFFLLYQYLNKLYKINRQMRKPSICSNCTADQRLCFRYSDSSIPFFLKSEFSRFYPASEAVQTGFCQNWTVTQKVGFLTRQLKIIYITTPEQHKADILMHQSFVTTAPPPTGKGKDYYFSAFSALL